MKTIEIVMKLFGAFRQHGESLRFPVPCGGTMQDVRLALAQALESDGLTTLVFDSALADDEGILGEDRIFERDTALSILPPVCGG